jgi:hypothetical protein
MSRWTIRARLGLMLMASSGVWGGGNPVAGDEIVAQTQPADGTPISTTAPATTTPATAPATAPSVPSEAETPAVLRPRFELHVPSVQRLASEFRRSRSGVFGTHAGRMLTELASLSSEAVDVEGAGALVQQIQAWPDTSLDVAVYAADTDGRTRWAVRFDWPLKDLHARLAPLLTVEAAASLLAGVRVTPEQAGGYQMAVPEGTLAYLLPAGRAQALLASHPDVALPADPLRGTAESAEGGPALLVCRVNLKNTEKDSGATLLSSLSAVYDVVYSARVDAAGDWVERIDVHWPPGIGTVAKAAVNRVKQTFFVPNEAYGSGVFDVVGATALLDTMAGFGQQMIADESGELELEGEAGLGPIASHTSSELCVVLLPGTGFVPVPDVVLQARTGRAEKLITAIREATKKTNDSQRTREQPAPWHEATVRGHAVFWSDGSGPRGGLMVPATMRPVLFVSQDKDGKDRERDFLVLGLTSTSPERLVRRWLDLPRSKDRRYLPTATKTHGELWFNWRQAYHWVQPYINVGLSTFSRDLVVPRVQDVEASLTDASLTAEVKYSGLSVAHRGPIPVGVAALPLLLGLAAEMDDAGGSDLARERSACAKLRVLYHHAKLFKADMGRWPAEVAELDGYVDFGGHPELLRLDLSASKQRAEWLENVFGTANKDDEEKDQEAEDEKPGPEKDAFVVSWSRQRWTLGVAPGTLEHLEALYVDQDGNFHRVEKRHPASGPASQTSHD